MKRYSLLFLLIAGTAAFASNDFGIGDRPSVLTGPQLRERLQIDGDVAVLSPDGSKLLYESVEHRSWKFGEGSDLISSNWRYANSDGSLNVVLKHEWTVGDDGVIRAHIQQFDSMNQQADGKKITYGKKLREETITVKDFSPVLWTVSADEHQRVVARFHLSLQSKREAKDPSEIPIAVQNGILTDSKNRVWAHYFLTGSGKFMAITTHLGMLAISFYPFPGASVIGTAEGNDIEVKGKDLRLRMRSEKPFVMGSERMKVYGLVDTGKRTPHPGSVGMSTSDDVKKFMER